MAEAILDGIRTRYEILGAGEPLLLFSPGGFDATLEKWRTLGVYARTRLLERLQARYRCIVFDRRESGGSGGRVEPLTWRHYAAQGRALLDHLGIERAHLLGGCMGCAPVLALACTTPQRVASMLLYWPVGGARYRLGSHQRFATHLEFVERHGLAEVAALARASAKSFGEDPRVGPWVSVLRSDARFAEEFRALEKNHYADCVQKSRAALFDRDTAPGADPEALMRLEIPALIVPGRDPSHATSAARYLEECLAGAQYWDALPEAQTEASAPARVLDFLAEVSA